MSSDTTPAYPSAIPTPILRVLLDLLAVIETESARLRADRASADRAIEDLAALADCVGEHVDVMERRPVLDSVDGWDGLAQYEAVERVLASSPVPLTRTEIAARMGEVGRDDDVRQVSSGLDYLRRQGRAEVGDDHRWRLVYHDAEPAAVV